MQGEAPPVPAGASTSPLQLPQALPGSSCPGWDWRGSVGSARLPSYGCVWLSRSLLCACTQLILMTSTAPALVLVNVSVTAQGETSPTRGAFEFTWIRERSFQSRRGRGGAGSQPAGTVSAWLPAVCGWGWTCVGAWLAVSRAGGVCIGLSRSRGIH